MPFTNEIAIEINQGEWDEKSYRRKDLGGGVTVLVGKRPGEDTTKPVSYRFDADKFTVEQAKQWLKDKKIEFGKVWPATAKQAEASAPGTLANDFLFVELGTTDLTNNKPFDGMAAGSFIDMHGQHVVFTKADLQAYAANTKDAIASSVGESGELVGLPIDKTNHDHQGGAGWIVGAELTADGTRIRLTPRWTESGQALISAGERRFFSPTADTESKVILGGSLCNWPGSRNAKGLMALRAIELGSNIQTPEITTQALEQLSQVEQSLTEALGTIHNLSAGNDAGTEIPSKESPEMPTQTAVPAELAALGVTDPANVTKFIELQNKQVNDRVTELLAAEGRKQHIAEFSMRSIGGTADNPNGLPLTRDEIVDLMNNTTPEGQKKLEAALEKIRTAGLTKFVELGHNGQLNGGAELPAWAKPLLTKWIIEGKRTVAEFFAMNQAELGEASAYNLSEFAPKE